MVLMDDHAQPVVEREGLIGNVDRLHELRNRRGLTCLCLGERGTGGDQRGRRGKSKGKAVKTGHGRSSRKTGERTFAWTRRTALYHRSRTAKPRFQGRENRRTEERSVGKEWDS